MCEALSHGWLYAFLFLLSLLGPVRGDFDPSQSYQNLSQAFPPLASFYDPFPSRPINLGGQNFTRCCLQAVLESYDLDKNGHVVLNPSTNYTGLSPENFAKDQFPCGAGY